MKYLMGAVMRGRAAKELFKELIIVAGIVEAHGESQVGYGTEILPGIHQLFGGFIDSVFHQIFKGAHLQGSRKASAALAFAYMDTVSDFLESQRLRMVCPYIEHGFFDALLILRDAGRKVGF